MAKPRRDAIPLSRFERLLAAIGETNERLRQIELLLGKPPTILAPPTMNIPNMLPGRVIYGPEEGMVTMDFETRPIESYGGTE